MLLAIILSLSVATFTGFASAFPTVKPRQQACNGYAEYCDRIYSNVSWIGTHDSAFVGNTSDLRVNQELSVAYQLNAGIRFLQAQTHKNILGNGLEMCHTSCFELDAGSLAKYLTTVKDWLDSNPNEVLTLLLTNGDSVNVTMFDKAFDNADLKDYVFVPSTSPDPLPISSWPTYGDLISNGTRLVAFLDYGAEASLVPYILDEFTYFFETPYDTTDPNFAECTLDRPPNGSPDGRMYIVNHFLDKEIIGIDYPDNDADFTTNAAAGNGSIGAQADLCSSTYGRQPNFVLVDMFDRGDVFTWQDSVNGVASS